MTQRITGRPAEIARWCTCLPAVVIALFPVASQAYVGPGAGLGMIGSLIAVVVAVVVAIAGLLILPFRLLLKRRNRDVAGEGQARVDDSRNNES